MTSSSSTSLECFDTVSWASEDHVVCKKLSDKVQVLLTVQRDVQMICI